MEMLVPVALFLSLAAVILGVTRTISEGRTRRQLIQAGVTSEVAAALVASTPPEGAREASLRWGIITGTVGVALVVVQFLPYGRDEPISLGVVLLFAAAGLLLYSRIARRPVA